MAAPKDFPQLMRQTTVLCKQFPTKRSFPSHRHTQIPFFSTTVFCKRFPVLRIVWKDSELEVSLRRHLVSRHNHNKATLNGHVFPLGSPGNNLNSPNTDMFSLSFRNDSTREPLRKKDTREPKERSQNTGDLFSGVPRTSCRVAKIALNEVEDSLVKKAVPVMSL